jgi:hypothetical protein
LALTDASSRVVKIVVTDVTDTHAVLYRRLTIVVNETHVTKDTCSCQAMRIYGQSVRTNSRTVATSDVVMTNHQFTGGRVAIETKH